MQGWRNDIKIIAKAIAGASAGNWRSDVQKIADVRGIYEKDWRKALYQLREQHGVYVHGWRETLAAVALRLGAPVRLDWRSALRFIRAYYSETPPETSTSFFLALPPRKPDTEYKILANGVIEADKIIMA